MRNLAWFVMLAIAGAPARVEAASCLQVERDYGPRGKVDLRVETVASGLEVPWGLAFLPDGAMLVTERPGRIDRIVRGKVIEIARVPVARGSESGLLGLALHPEFARTRWFYIYFTAETPDGPRNRVERWRLADDNASARVDRVILDGIPSAPYHDGGRLAFGPDGMLYISIGDATRPELAQALDSPAGKILRLTADGDVPTDNPFRGSPVYVLGVRNVEGFDWREGELVVVDHGPSGELGRHGHDEVSFAYGGANLGWPTIYGCESREGMVTPILTWTAAVPPGGAVIYDGSIQAWRGDLLIGTLRSHHLHHVQLGPDDLVVAHDVQLEDRGRLRTLVMGPDHELYVTTSNCDGRGTCPAQRDAILRVTEARPRATARR